MWVYGETVQKAKPTIFDTMEGRPDDRWPELRRKIRDVLGLVRQGVKVRFLSIDLIWNRVLAPGDLSYPI